MADTWTPISGYTPQEYTDTAVFEVNSDTKKIALITGQALVAGEENAQYIKFLMPRYWDGIDIKDKAFYAEYALAGQYYGKTAVVNAEYNDEKVRFGWVVPKEACCISGTLLFILRIESTEYVLKTQIAEHPVFKSVNVEDVVPEPTKEAWYRDFAARVEVAIDEAEAALAQAQQAVVSAETAAQNAQAAEDNAEAAAATAQIRYGSPLIATEADQMIDENRVYVYTGSESGYTAGNWYYYDGTEWADGGVYNGSAVNTDTTLTQSGMAADAKATGDKIKSIVNSAYVTDSASGSVAHFTDGADNVPMKSVKVNVEPVQSGSGDPSPSNVRAISGRDSVAVTRSGKNLLQCPTSGGRTNSGITWTYNSDGSVTASGTATGNSWSYTNPSTVTLPPGTYTVSVTSPFGMVVQNLTDGGYIHNGGYSQVTFTLNKLTNVGVHARVGNGTTIDATTGIQIEVGTEATEFEPYNGNTYTISLSSAGTVYGGTLDVTSGELTVDRKYELFDGSSDEAWQFLTGSFGKRCGIVRNDVLNTGSRVKVDANEGVYSASANTVGTVFASGVSIYYYPPDAVTSLESWRTWLVSNPLQVVYPLATPLTYQLTATEVKSLLGINNIWADAGDIECEYRADTRLYIKRLTDSDMDMIADANIVSGQYFMVGNNLYKATANIASGAQIVVGTNATKVSLSEALNQINA